MVHAPSPPSRNHYDLKLNETSSIQDEVFSNGRKMDRLSTPEQRISASREKIEDHVDKRITLFFQQLIATYDVPFKFKIGKTQDQGPSTKTLNAGNGINVQFDSAHSATIPCLYAYPRAKWNQYKKGEGPKPKPFVYLHGSDTYNNHNATMGLIKPVNQADSAIDGKETDANKLRKKSIKIINRCARGKLDPVSGLEKFLEKFEQILVSQKHEYDKKREDDKIQQRLQILNIYLERVRNAIDGSQEGEFFDQLIGVTVADETPRAADLRKLVYSSRFTIIRESQEAQSRIMEKIDKVAQSIRKTERRKPKNLDALLKREILLNSGKTRRRQLTRFFGVSVEQIEKDFKIAKEKNVVRKEVYEQKLTKLHRKIRAIYYSLTQDELQYRSRESQKVQSRIMEEIDKVAQAIRKTEGGEPENLEALLKREILLNSGKTRRRQLTRFFGVSVEQIEKDLKIAKEKNVVRKKVYEQKLTKLHRKIRAICYSLTQDELQYRSSMTRDLRDHYEWTQKDLVANYREVYRNGPMSQSTVSRLENAVKTIDRKSARHLAKVFGVDPGFFFPAIFTSEK